MDRTPVGYTLARLDATIRLFSPDTKPDAILAKRPYWRTRYFGRNELSRLVMEALRLATVPLAVADIATVHHASQRAPMDDAAFKPIVTARALGVLRGFAKRGEIVKSGTSRNAQWAVTPSLL